jgi:LmbE family N-acetylglucosaminyl deacetylase
MPNKWVYLSPHFDDAALSVGGLIWEQVQQGEMVEIWTVCGGMAPEHQPLSEFAKSLHSIWRTSGETPKERAKEDEIACLRLGASFRHLPWPDCIYRYDPETLQPFVKAEEDLYKPFSQGELTELMNLFSSIHLPKGAHVAVPFGIGSHRDHTLTRAVGERFFGSVWHYQDYPYSIQENNKKEGFFPESSVKLTKQLSAEGLSAWKEAIASYASQMAFFWKDEFDMNRAIDAYAEKIKKEFLNTFLWKF